MTTLEDAVQYLLKNTGDRPNTREVVAALAAAEKQSKKEKRRYDYTQLVGAWRLGFVSGTKTQKSPTQKGQKQPSSKATKQLGSGRFLPRWIDVSITYGPQKALLKPNLIDQRLVARSDEKESTDPVSALPLDEHEELSARLGAVVNRVALGAIALQLSGPTYYWPNTNSLGFDFVYLQGEVGRFTLYSAPVRGGVERAQTFANQTLKDQAFFTFFAVTETYLAARGKGGGLALWTRA